VGESRAGSTRQSAGEGEGIYFGGVGRRGEGYYVAVSVENAEQEGRVVLSSRVGESGDGQLARDKAGSWICDRV
jgi:hypothetical protein